MKAGSRLASLAFRRVGPAAPTVHGVLLVLRSMWPWLHLDAITFGRTYIWPPLHLGAVTCGPRYIWPPLHLGAVAFGPRYIWASSDLGAVTLLPGKPCSRLGGKTIFEFGEAARGATEMCGFRENRALASAGTLFFNSAKPRAAPPRCMVWWKTMLSPRRERGF